MNARSGAAAALARAEAAGLRLALDHAGGVRMQAAVPPPAEVVADLRRHREAVAALLAERARAAFLARAAEDAAAALAVPDPDLDHERAVMAGALAAEARGDLGRPKPEAEHRQHLAALLDGAMQRPPAWADQSSRPAPGWRCSSCRGRRWWAPERASRDSIGPAPGWRCATCRPAPPGAGKLVTVET